MENKEKEEIAPVKQGLRKMKIGAIILASLTIILIVVTVLFGGVVFKDSTNYAIKINDEKISVSEFQVYLKWQMGDMQANSSEEIIWDNIDEESGVPYIELAKDFTVDVLKEIKVQLQEAERRNIVLTDAEKNYISALVKYYVAENEALEDFALTEDDWIKIYEEYEIINKLTLEIANEKFTPYDARHILLLTEGKTEEEKLVVKQKAQNLLDKVLNGEDFAKLATENSEDGGSVNNGGLYEGVSKGAFVKEFEDAALSLKDGEIYPNLVESSYGYHIIKLEKKISDTKITQLDDSIRYNYFSIVVKDWMENAEVEKGQQFISIR